MGAAPPHSSLRPGVPIEQAIKPELPRMDTALTNSIIHTATALSAAQTSEAVNVTVLKKAIDIQADAAATLLQALPQPSLATSGTLGTQVNVYA